MYNYLHYVRQGRSRNKDKVKRITEIRFKTALKQLQESYDLISAMCVTPEKVIKPKLSNFNIFLKCYFVFFFI